MVTARSNKATTTALAEELILGTNKHLASATQVMVAGTLRTPAEITAQLQTLVTLRRDVETAKASLKSKIALEAADRVSLHAFMGAYLTFVKATFASKPDVLADFGIHPKARAQLTVEAKAAAAAKRLATRAARHTMGSKQKKGVKGGVTGVLMTPIDAAHPAATPPTGPSAPAPAGTPAGVTPRTTA